jgi:hypothetical protein
MDFLNIFSQISNHLLGVGGTSTSNSTPNTPLTSNRPAFNNRTNYANDDGTLTKPSFDDSPLQAHNYPPPPYSTAQSRPLLNNVLNIDDQMPAVGRTGGHQQQVERWGKKRKNFFAG